MRPPVAVVASGASGLAACSGLLVRGAKLYTAVDTAAGFAQAGQHLYEGNAGVGDALAFLPAVSYGVSRALGDVKCFAAGTEVLAAGEGGVGFAEVAIEDVRVGDLVWARDDANPDAPMALKRVTQLFRRQAHDLQSLSLAAEGGHAETLTVTDGHPFWVRGLGWTEAARLTVGMELVTADGATLAVVGNADDYRPDGVTVYNFEVADAHTYFVADGQGDDTFVWAHNACKIAGTQGLAHSFDRHGRDWLQDYGYTPTIEKWEEILTEAIRSKKTFPWSTKSDETVASFARIKGTQPILVQAFKAGSRAGELATAFRPSKTQMSGIIRMLKGSR